MATETVSAAHVGAAKVSIPSAVLANILASVRGTIERLVVIDDLCTVGLLANCPDSTDGVLKAIRHTMGNDPDGLYDLVPEIEELLRAQP